MSDPDCAAHSVTLRSGETLEIELLEPPVRRSQAREIGRHIQRFLDEPFIPELLAGAHAESFSIRVVAARLRGELVGTGWVGWGRREPESGVMTGVAVKPEARDRGVGSAVSAALCRAFDARGGRRLYAAAATDAARAIYKKLGFGAMAGQLLRRGDGPPMRAAREGGAALLERPADWGDVPAVVPLYGLPHACVLTDGLAELASARVEPPHRCVGLFWRLWDASVARRGAWRVLAAERGPICASVTARPGWGGFLFDFLWDADCAAEGDDFVQRTLAEWERRWGAPRLRTAASDSWKRATAAKWGFTRLAADDEAIRVGARSFRLVELTRM